jgi:hypothetical protein
VCVPAHTVASCSTTEILCNSSCNEYPDSVQGGVTGGNISPANATLVNQEYLAMIRCLATNFTATTQYTCSEPPTTYGAWTPKNEASCENLVCAWTCDDANNGTGLFDQAVYDRCKAANKGGVTQCL